MVEKKLSNSCVWHWTPCVLDKHIFHLLRLWGKCRTKSRYFRLCTLCKSHQILHRVIPFHLAAFFQGRLILGSLKSSCTGPGTTLASDAASMSSRSQQRGRRKHHIILPLFIPESVIGDCLTRLFEYSQRPSAVFVVNQSRRQEQDERLWAKETTTTIVKQSAGQSFHGLKK